MYNVINRCIWSLKKTWKIPNKCEIMPESRGKKGVQENAKN